MRTTHALVQAAQALLADPDAKHWGYGLAKKAGIRSGVLYPILTRMLDEGWVTDGWEDPAATKRAPRRFYELTDLGRTQLRDVLAEASTDPRFANFNLEETRR